jgi:cobalt-zinc-cadmium efflux system membrane fusion protein
MKAYVIAIGFVCATSGCSREQARPVATEQKEADKAPAETSADILQIDPGMLRDLRMTTAAVEQRSGAADVDMLGEIDVNRDAYAEVAPPIDAQVIRLLASVDTTIDQGQALAELRSPDVGRARAEVSAAEARAQLAAQVLERKRSLAGERIVATREVQEAQSQYDEAQATLRAATSALRALGVELGDAAAADPSRFTLRSPIAGTVLERRAVVGQLAPTSEPLFKVANLRRLWLTVHAFERDAVQIRPRTPVRITLAAMPGREFRGQIAVVGRQVDPASRTVDVRVDLTNQDGSLRPGMSVTAHVPVEGATRTLLTVPAAAVQRVGEQWVVFSPAGDGRFRVRPVGRGRDLGAEVEIVSGLAAADTVVVEGAFLLKAEAEKRAGGGDHEHEG